MVEVPRRRRKSVLGLTDEEEAELVKIEKQHEFLHI